MPWFSFILWGTFFWKHEKLFLRLHCRCLVADFNGGCSPLSGFPICPRPQLPAFHSNSSQLNSSRLQKTPFLCCCLQPLCSCLFRCCCQATGPHPMILLAAPSVRWRGREIYMFQQRWREYTSTSKGEHSQRNDKKLNVSDRYTSITAGRWLCLRLGG
jgi:hypothetical protein